MLLRNLSEVYKKGLIIMSELYKRIESLCQNEGMTITTMCKKSGASRASLSDLKFGRKQSLSADTLSKIAKTLGVSVSFLLGHEVAWSAAVKKFGFCWEVRYREDKKGDARAIVDNPSSSLSDKVNAQTIVFKALFSRSLEASGYSLDHVDFPTYTAMILNQGEGKHFIPIDVHRGMVSIYGTKPGIPQGTYYVVPNKTTPTVSGKRCSDCTSMSDRNVVRIAGRNGSYQERILTDEQLAALKAVLDQMPNATDDL